MRDERYCADRDAGWGPLHVSVAQADDGIGWNEQLWLRSIGRGGDVRM
jgi:hypothetical protein